MYRLSNSEFRIYESAEIRLRELRKQHVMEIQRAYDGICPTLSRFNYEEGAIYAESINPEDYAIYLIELKDEHEHQQRWWRVRAAAYQEALKQLTEEEKTHLNGYGAGTYQQTEMVRNKLRQALIEIIETRPELQRQAIPLDEIEDMEEADRQIEKMSMKELLEDYWDLEEQTGLKKQCIRLFQTYGWSCKRIGKKLGVSTASVREYVNSIE